MFRKNKEITALAKQAQDDRNFFAEQMQKDREYLAKQLASIKAPVQTIKNETTEQINDIDKKKAAYALNMCTVSVSQIIDYNDVYVLEQEYEAILNNLNLEKIIKDEALLKTLKLLLDTITFFRIQEKEKEIIEKEYQNKLKNAIWGSMPNPAVILATGNPYAMIAALATQVGIGYMNYRKNKNDATIEKDQRNWELQKSAIEQFNGIRRELFDASWRLSDKYQFPEEYRLTEKQIKQYDHILMDKNYIRKYERLSSIADNFKAYPYFWYYLGNTANMISADNQLNISEEDRNKYQSLAIEHFSKFEELDNISILREDLIASSCYIEHAELLTVRNEDKTKISALIKKAISKCGGDCDVLQICAISYLKINAVEDAKPIFKQLIVEGYNQKANSQLLSCIYVSEALLNNRNARFEYNSLKLLISPNQDYLLKMPIDQKLLENKNDAPRKFEIIINDYIDMQKEILFKEYRDVIAIYANRYNEKFDNCIPKKSTNRKDKSINNIDEFIRLSVETGFPDNAIDVLNNMIDGINDLGLKETDVEIIKRKIYSNGSEEKTAIEKLTELIYGESDNQKPDIKKLLAEINFNEFANNYIEQLIANLKNLIYSIDNFLELSESETVLYKFCRKNNIILSAKYSNYHIYEKTLPSLIDNIQNKEEIEKKKELKGMIKDYADKIINSNSFDMIIFGENASADQKIRSYQTSKLKYDVILGVGGTQIKENEILAVLDNNGEAVIANNTVLDSLIFTTVGIGRIEITIKKNGETKKEVRKSLVPYDKVTYKHGSLTIKGYKYNADKYLDLNNLFMLIQSIKDELKKHKQQEYQQLH